MMKVEDLLNQILAAGRSSAEPDAKSAEGPLESQAYLSHSTSVGEVKFRGRDLTTLLKCSETLHQVNKEVAEGFTATDLKDRAVAFLGSRFVGRGDVTRDEGKAFVAELLAEPEAEYTIYSEISGVAMLEWESVVRFGPFTVCHYPTHRHKIVDTVTHATGWDKTQEFKYTINVSVISKTVRRAHEKADRLFARFEKVLRFFLGPASYVDIGILNYRGQGSRRTMTLEGGVMVAVQTSTVGPLHPFPIDIPGISDERASKAWRLTDPTLKLSPLEVRIVRAMEWLGEASQEMSVQSAFLKAAIALELLLVGKDSNFITSSITARLAETLAMLVGRTPAERAEVEEQAKKFYSKRSAVAHSGNSSVDWGGVQQMVELGRRAIFTLLEDEDLRTMTTVEEVVALFARKKYSFADFKEVHGSAQD